MSNPPQQGGYYDPQGQHSYSGQYPQYGQPQGPGQQYANSYNGGYGQPNLYGQGKPKRGGRGGKITFFIGLGMLVLGIILSILGAIQTFNSLLGGIDLNSQSLPNQFSGSTTFEGSDEQGLVAFMALNGPSATCEVTGPDGNQVPLDSTQSGSQSVEDGGEQVTVETVGMADISEAGTYNVSCSGAEAFGYVQVGSDMLGWTAAVMIGILLVVVGFVVAIIGLIVWLTGRKRITYV